MSKSSIITKTASSPAVATPDRVTTHPGEVLAEEFLKPLELSVNALAIALRVPATRIFFEEAPSFASWITSWAEGVDLWDRSYGQNGLVTRALAERAHPA